MDHSTIPSIEDAYTPAGMSGMDQSFQSLDVCSWPASTHGPVDLGLTPQLSYECQNEAASYCPQETNPYGLPYGQGMSFHCEPAFQGPLVYSSPEVSLPPGQVDGHPCCDGFCAAPMACASARLIALYPGSLPLGFTQDAYAPYSLDEVAHAPVSSTRQVLPRTEGPNVAGQPAFGSQRVLRPQVARMRMREPSAADVSKDQGPLQHLPMEPMHPASSPSRASYHGHGRRVSVLAPLIDPTAEDFAAFVRLEQEHCGNSSRGHHGRPPNLCTSPVDLKPRQDFNQNPMDSGREASTTPNEIEEGRHRTHPAYSALPHSDGLYHCPYENGREGACSHRPTKLKCNYDKYIDSHVKPFRCKEAACRTAEFSSTACLLRHEREAHGLHGHGDRPHACIYEGCDRGQVGNGFPRKYNLNDHMRRMHGHQESPEESAETPALGKEIRKRTKAGKRRASSPLERTLPVQRQKAVSLPTRQALPTRAGRVSYHAGSGYGQ